MTELNGFMYLASIARKYRLSVLELFQANKTDKAIELLKNDKKAASIVNTYKEKYVGTYQCLDLKTCK